METTTRSLIPYIVLFSVSVVMVAGDQRVNHGTQIEKVESTASTTIFCYFASYSWGRKGVDTFDVEDIDPFACTHLTYAFARLDKTNYTIVPNNAHHDLDYGDGAFRRFINLKKRNPDLKTLLSIGGWGDGTLQYSQMVSDPKKRTIFVASVVELLTTYGFDGLDFDWEYPGGRGGKGGLPTDKENFVLLLRELKASFENYKNIYGGSRLLLTAAVNSGKWSVGPSYDVSGLSDVLDFINLMTYDFHSWSPSRPYTGHNSPLFALPEEKDPRHPGHNLNSDFAVRNWIRNGAQPSKILMGMGAYGRGYILADPTEQHGFYAEAIGQIGPALNTSGLGVWTFTEYCQRMKSEQNEWELYRDQNAVAPYIVKGNNWLGFDDVESVRVKSEYIKNMGLGGAMLWTIDMDDFNGICGEKYGLLKSIAKALNGNTK